MMNVQTRTRAYVITLRGDAVRARTVHLARRHSEGWLDAGIKHVHAHFFLKSASELEKMGIPRNRRPPFWRYLVEESSVEGVEVRGGKIEVSDDASTHVYTASLEDPEFLENHVDEVDSYDDHSIDIRTKCAVRAETNYTGEIAYDFRIDREFSAGLLLVAVSRLNGVDVVTSVMYGDKELKGKSSGRCRWQRAKLIIGEHSTGRNRVIAHAKPVRCKL